MTTPKVQTIDTGYRPRPLQYLLHKNLKRFNVLVCHRRWGKTIFCINQILNAGLNCPLRNPQYAYIAPNYRQAKRIAWDPLIEYARKLPGFHENKQELTISIKRMWLQEPDTVKIMLLGSEDPDTLRGLYLDGAIFDEYAQCEPMVWGEVVRPALSDRRGWAIFIGTPKGENHFKKRYDDALRNKEWFTVLYKASETDIIPYEELVSMKAEMDESEYAQEMECDFSAAIKGSYYGPIIEALFANGRIGDFKYDPALPVDTYWDLGTHDSAAIWFRQRLPGGDYRYIEYYEESGSSIPELAKVVNQKPYSYGRHVLPWDANVKEMGTGKTRIEMARKFLKGVQLQKRQPVADRIQATRLMLNKSYFDYDNCRRGVDALKSYQKEWDDKAQLFKNNPLHDWTSHASDAYGYSALDDRLSFFGNQQRDDLPRMAEKDYNIFS